MVVVPTVALDEFGGAGGAEESGGVRVGDFGAQDLEHDLFTDLGPVRSEGDRP